jgi:hypothetical protein
LFRSIKCDCVGADAVTPEGAVETVAQARCLEFKLPGLRFLAEPPRTARSVQLGGIDVALDFSECDRPFGEPAVGMKYGILGVFPALIGEAPVSRTLVFDKTIAIDVSVNIDPAKRGFHVWP